MHSMTPSKKSPISYQNVETMTGRKRESKGKVREMKTDFMEHEMNCKELKRHVFCDGNLEKQIVKNKANVSNCMTVVAKHDLSAPAAELAWWARTKSECGLMVVVVVMSAAAHSPPASASLSVMEATLPAAAPLAGCSLLPSSALLSKVVWLGEVSCSCLHHALKH